MEILKKEYKPEFVEQVEFFSRYKNTYMAYKRLPEGQHMMVGDYPNHIGTGAQITSTELLEYLIENNHESIQQAGKTDNSSEYQQTD